MLLNEYRYVAETLKHMEFSEAVAALQKLGVSDLTQTIARIESSLQGVTNDTFSTALGAWGRHK